MLVRTNEDRTVGRYHVQAFPYSDLKEYAIGHVDVRSKEDGQRQRMRTFDRHWSSVSGGPSTVTSSARFHRVT
jgi:hypothetical protein